MALLSTERFPCVDRCSMADHDDDSDRLPVAAFFLGVDGGGGKRSWSKITKVHLASLKGLTGA